MADISKIKTPDGTTYDIKDTTARANSGVTGVKGNAEGSYRTGNVNLTPVNIGATSASVLPNDEGEIKTKFRISNKGYTGSGNPSWYYPLVKLPKDGSSNYASLIVSGRIGGWIDGNMSYVQALIWNRGSTGIALMDIAGTATAMSAIWGICDIVAYTNSDDTDTVYLLAKSYFTYDLDIELYQSAATILYDGTYQTTTPTGTLNAQASTTTKRVEIVNGKLLVGGTDISVVSNLTGTLGVDHGGTGKTTAKDAANVFMNALDTGSSTPADADYYISQYVNGGTTTTTYHRRPMSALWDYVKGKISSILGLTVTQYGGNAATATNASKVNNHTVAVDVPSGAKFTDTTYSAGTGISLSGTTFSNSGVTGVKGNSESSYRTGQVNLTAANVGAVATSGNETVSGNKTFSGTTSLTAGSTYPAQMGTIIQANSSAIIQSPVPKYLWHDLWAFCRATTPTYYTTTDGTNWTQGTLDKRLFGHANAWGASNVINSTISGSRWVWHDGGFAYCSGAWLALGVAYSDKIAKFDLKLEATSNATAASPTWTELCSVTNASYNQTPIWIKTNGPSVNDVRLTITRASGEATTTMLPLCSIMWLSSRWGNQGKGEEYEHPYSWDSNYNIYPLSGAKFVGDVTGDVTGNASGTASNVTGTVAIGHGGTGATSAQNATWNLLHVADPGDLNNAKRGGSFKISNTTTNTPVANMWGATINVTDDSAGGNTGTSGSTWQIALQSANNKMWLRCITNAASWTGWAQFYSTANKPSKSDVGLGNVDNKSSATIRGEITSSNVTTALGYTPANVTSAVTNVALSTNKITKTINGSTTDVVTAATTGAYGITKLSTSTSSTATDLAATPSAVKTAYDLANTANGTANTALSGVNGNLIYDHTFTISNGVATFTPHVYQKGSEVTTNYNKSCFTWKYRLIDGSEVTLTTKNDRGCDVTISNMGYGGHVIGMFTPA